MKLHTPARRPARAALLVAPARAALLVAPLLAAALVVGCESPGEESALDRRSTRSLEPAWTEPDPTSFAAAQSRTEALGRAWDSAGREAGVAAEGTRAPATGSVPASATRERE